ncbi:MAG: RAD55 family ATPase [Candidatus Thermoplasmatota archaeon]|nr:RAD55 family ATPase [Candidatus Thermoplasmatota archaeon]
MALNRLDKLVKGGIPKNTLVLLEGPPGSGKTTLCGQILKDALENGTRCVFVTTDSSPSQVLDRMAIYGWDMKAHAEKGNIQFVDCYSWRMGESDAVPNTLRVGNIGDLSDLSIKISEALNALGEGGVVVFDTPSTLMLHSPPQAILKFLEVSFAKLKSRKATLFVTVEKGVHDEQFAATLKYMVDGVIELKLDEEKGALSNFLRIFTLKTATSYERNWNKVLLMPEGLVIGG